MTMRYKTREGDTVDSICWEYYGGIIGSVEKVLEANPGLAAKGAVLDAGIVVTLPDIPSPPERRRRPVRLWD